VVRFAKGVVLLPELRFGKGVVRLLELRFGKGVVLLPELRFGKGVVRCGVCVGGEGGGGVPKPGLSSSVGGRTFRISETRIFIS
jgi:hypothetical protein